jgi:hypothetical protein
MRDAADALIENLLGQNRELDLSDVEPATVFRRVVDLELLREPPRFGGLERLVEGGEGVRTEIVEYQYDALGVGVLVVGEAFEEVSEVDRCAPLGRFREGAAREGLHAEKDVGGATPSVFIVYSSKNAWARRERTSNMLEQLLARFIHANLRKTRVIGAVVNLEHVFHRVHKRGALCRGDAEALHLPGFEPIFFSTADGRW